jgi:pimeloyl-ACP methyl ester carboxylesterase
VTLTGVGERVHLMSPAITLETFIADVVNAMKAEEMPRPVLAVHSFAGMIGTAIAGRMAQRLAHLVYVDAVVPQAGESWSSTHVPATRGARIAAAEASRDYSFPPPDPSVLTGAQHEWVRRRQVPHPGIPTPP